MSDPNNTYQHTQVGVVILASLVIGILIVALGFRNAVNGVPTGTMRAIIVAFLGSIILLVTIVAVIFSSLTIQIRDGTLRWHFTGTLIRGSVAARDIESVTEVRNPAAYGWGLRKTSQGTLYRVSGLDAVHIRTRDGREFSLGSDEPARLVQAIEASRRSQGAP